MSQTPGPSAARPNQSNPAHPTSSGFLRQLVLLIAIILTFCTAAFGVVWVLTYPAVSQASFDAELANLMAQNEAAAQKLSFENYMIGQSGCVNGESAVSEQYQADTDRAISALTTAAKTVGVGNLKLTEDQPDRLIKMLLDDPTGRLEEARAEVCMGRINPDDMDHATMENLIQTTIDLAAKGPGAVRSESLRDFAQAYADEAATNLPWTNTEPPPDNDRRQNAVNALVANADTADNQAAWGPTTFKWVAIGLAVLALGAWALLFMGRRSWAKAAPKAAKAKKPGKAPKAEKPGKAQKEKKPGKPVTATKAAKAETPAKVAPPKPAAPARQDTTSVTPPAKTPPTAPVPPRATPAAPASGTPKPPAGPPPAPAAPAAPSQPPAPQPTGDRPPASPPENGKKPGGPRIPWRTTGGSET